MRFDVLDRTRSATKSPLLPNRFFSFYFKFLMPQVNENAKIKNKNKRERGCPATYISNSLDGVVVRDLDRGGFRLFIPLIFDGLAKPIPP